MTIAIMWGFFLTTSVYVMSTIMGTNHRMSGNFFYDYFMGACLNPRVGILDLKMWAEIRVPWPILFSFYTSLSCALKQYETRGYVTGPAAFMVPCSLFVCQRLPKG